MKRAYIAVPVSDDTNRPQVGQIVAVLIEGQIATAQYCVTPIGQTETVPGAGRPDWFESDAPGTPSHWLKEIELPLINWDEPVKKSHRDACEQMVRWSLDANSYARMDLLSDVVERIARDAETGELSRSNERVVAVEEVIDALFYGARTSEDMAHNIAALVEGTALHFKS